MIKYTERIGEEILVKRPVAPGENVIFTGEDYAKGALILPGGGSLFLAGCGDPRRRRVRQGRRIPGNQSSGSSPQGTRSPSLSTQHLARARSQMQMVPCASPSWKRAGCQARPYGMVRDNRDALGRAINRAIGECDAILLSGGSSKDVRDLAASMIAEKGEVLVHGIGIAPGKPTIIGRASRSRVHRPPRPSRLCLCHPPYPCEAPSISAMFQDTASGRGGSPSSLPKTSPPRKGGWSSSGSGSMTAGPSRASGRAALLDAFAGSDGLVQVPAGSRGNRRRPSRVIPSLTAATSQSRPSGEGVEEAALPEARDGPAVLNPDPDELHPPFLGGDVFGKDEGDPPLRPGCIQTSPREGAQQGHGG